MNRATTYLKQILTTVEYDVYRSQCVLDCRDSEARQRWRWLSMPYHQQSDRKQTILAWLQRYGYADADGNRLGPEK